MEEEAPESPIMDVDAAEIPTKKIDNVRGKPKSGRWWKDPQKHRHTHIIQVKPLKINAAKNKQECLRRQMIKAKEAEIRDGLAAEKAAKLQAQKEREERRKVNERRGEVVQVIRNAAKLAKNKKRKLRKIETRDTN